MPIEGAKSKPGMKSEIGGTSGAMAERSALLVARSLILVPMAPLRLG
jgi:hypothetical protein